MSMTTRLSLFLASTTLLVACVDGTVVEPGRRGGNRTDSIPCYLGQSDANNPWNRAGVMGVRTQPVKCPFMVTQAITYVTLASEIRVPKQTSSSQGYATFWGIWSMFDGYRLASSQGRYYQDHPTLSDFRRAEFSGTYLAGYLGSMQQWGPWSHDSGYVTAETDYGEGRANMVLSGGVQSLGAYVLTNLGAGLQATVRAVTDADTNRYSYSWAIDGQPVGFDNAVIDAYFPSSGIHTVTAYAAYLNGVDTISATLNVYDASIDGPSTVKPFATCSWSASMSGGTSPFSYSWTVPGGLAVQINGSIT